MYEKQNHRLIQQFTGFSLEETPEVDKGSTSLLLNEIVNYISVSSKHNSELKLTRQYIVNELIMTEELETVELLYLNSTLDHSHAFRSFKVDDICELAKKFYPEDFTYSDLYTLIIQLEYYSYQQSPVQKFSGPYLGLKHNYSAFGDLPNKLLVDRPRTPENLLLETTYTWVCNLFVVAVSQSHRKLDLITLKMAGCQPVTLGEILQESGPETQMIKERFLSNFIVGFVCLNGYCIWWPIVNFLFHLTERTGTRTAPNIGPDIRHRSEDTDENWTRFNEQTHGCQVPSQVLCQLGSLNLAIEWVPDSDSDMENTTILPHNMADSRL
ncbi:hypothetical protein FNV43_RR00647 [Rhamnella rubrinervis]|uniref:Uncharacterized protein n=1 Tax=Rhamnella rubrinervis TaxID=2594499 RepID=A0A8K0MS56_9ROSA|nr:hypothetical protein FNV43_RR00647 [Rhamnella rubrinervis]